MTRPVPLMYVRKIPVAFEEESTSVFVKEEFEAPIEGLIVDAHLLAQLQKTQTSFGKHLYRPITLEIESGETYTGSVEQLTEEMAFLKVEEGDTVQSIPLHQITDIIWRGTSLIEKN